MKNYSHSDFSATASPLYSKQILQYGKIYGKGRRLKVKNISISKTGALCGSRIIVDLLWQSDNDGSKYIADIGYHVDACALGTASAAICAAAAKGCFACDIENVASNLKNMLQNKKFSFKTHSGWSELQCLQAAYNYPARHAAILLPTDAIMDAFNQP